MGVKRVTSHPGGLDVGARVKCTPRPCVGSKAEEGKAEPVPALWCERVGTYPRASGGREHDLWSDTWRCPLVVPSAPGRKPGLVPVGAGENSQQLGVEALETWQIDEV